jgi:hypothetical protein
VTVLAVAHQGAAAIRQGATVDHLGVAANRQGTTGRQSAADTG